MWFALCAWVNVFICAKSYCRIKCQWGSRLCFYRVMILKTIYYKLRKQDSGDLVASISHSSRADEMLNQGEISKTLERGKSATTHSDVCWYFRCRSLPNNHLLVCIHLLSHTNTYCFSKQVFVLHFQNRPFKLALPWQQLLPVEAGSLFLFCCVLFPMTKLLRGAVQLLPTTTIKQETALEKWLKEFVLFCANYLSVCVCVVGYI